MTLLFLVCYSFDKNNFIFFITIVNSYLMSNSDFKYVGFLFQKMIIFAD